MLDDDDDIGFRPVPKDTVDRLLGSVVEVSKLSEFLDTEDVDQTLAMTLSLIGRPDIPASVATPMITKLQALSFKFKMQAKYYMTLGSVEGNSDIKKNNTYKKNLYMSLAEETEKLVQALKYTTRNY